MNAHGRLVSELESDLSSRVKNMLTHHNREAMRRRAELVVRLRQAYARLQERKKS